MWVDPLGYGDFRRLSGRNCCCLCPRWCNPLWPVEVMWYLLEEEGMPFMFIPCLLTSKSSLHRIIKCHGFGNWNSNYVWKLITIYHCFYCSHISEAHFCMITQLQYYLSHVLNIAIGVLACKCASGHLWWLVSQSKCICQYLLIEISQKKTYECLSRFMPLWQYYLVGQSLYAITFMLQVDRTTVWRIISAVF